MDGLRVLESSLTTRPIQLTLSATPQIDPVTLAKIRDAALRIGGRREWVVSTLAVLPDYLQLALRGSISASPEAIALSFLNNLAHALGQRPWWQTGYYAGTF